MRHLSFSFDNLFQHKSVWGSVASLPVNLYWPANLWSTIRLFGLLPTAIVFNYDSNLGVICFLFILYTDGVDGAIARRQSPFTQWQLDPFFWFYAFGLIKIEVWREVGKWYDPLADKVFIISSFYYFGLILEPIVSPILFYLMVIIEVSNRGFIVPFVRKVIMKKPLYIKANKLGKAKFISESVVGILIMSYHLLDDQLIVSLVDILMPVIVILSLGSMLGHLWPEKFIKLKLLKP